MSDGFELDEMKEIIDSFIVEVAEHIENLDQSLVELEDNADDYDLLNKIFRAAHTIKGAASFLDFDLMAKVTHHAESVLDLLRKGKLQVNPEIMDVILEAVDKIKLIFEYIKENYQEDKSVVIDDVITQLDNIFNNRPPTEGLDKVKKPVRTTLGVPKEEVSQAAAEQPQEAPVPAETGVKPVEPIQETAAPESEPPTEQADQIEPEESKVTPAPKQETVPQAETAQATQSTEPKSATKPTPTQSKTIDKKSVEAVQTIRVDLKRIDNVMNLVQELVPGRNRLVQINKIFKDKLAESYRDYEDTLLTLTQNSNDLNSQEYKKSKKKFTEDITNLTEIYDEATSQIDLITTELQLAVMKTRMLPISNVFNKFPRMVRDLSRDIGKNIRLDMIGKETELDKSVIEIIGDPLMHCIRNSVDHGIEFALDRLNAGKPQQGTITLSAYHEGNYIVVQVIDDGKGMDADKLREKAVEKGIYSPEEAKNINNKDILNVIFNPGFSTAEKVTNVSGRGVGMDVLKSNIERLNGLIDVDTVLGKGSTVTIKIPLTLAIIQALLVCVNDEIYAIPLSSVIETVRIKKEDMKTIKKHQVYQLRDTILPLLELAHIFDIAEEPKDDNDFLYVVVLGIAEKRIGLIVGGLLGQEEIVVKSLGDFFEETPGIAGATIMGDGRVRLIVNVADTVDMAEGMPSGSTLV